MSCVGVLVFFLIHLTTYSSWRNNFFSIRWKF